MGAQWGSTFLTNSHVIQLLSVLEPYLGTKHLHIGTWANKISGEPKCPILSSLPISFLLAFNVYVTEWLTKILIYFLSLIVLSHSSSIPQRYRDLVCLLVPVEISVSGPKKVTYKIHPSLFFVFLKPKRLRGIVLAFFGRRKESGSLRRGSSEENPMLGRKWRSEEAKMLKGMTAFCI